MDCEKGYNVVDAKTVNIRIFISTPGRNRTLNLLIRSQTLYPIELRVHRNYDWKDNINMVSIQTNLFPTFRLIEK